MRRARQAMMLVALGALGAALVLGGCEKKAPEVTSAWPVANSERTVPKPPEPPRWPYTGKEASKPSLISRRPLSVKIENSPAARPLARCSSRAIR